MPDLHFQVEAAEPQRSAAAPVLVFRLRITDSAAEPMPIHTVALRCQIRIEPGRRRYSETEKQRLRDLFGTPERWGQTVRPMSWLTLSVVVPPFTGSGVVDLSVPCSSDFSLAATRYFAALEGGDLPLGFLFSGTIFHESTEGGLQAAPIAWEKEASFRLPAATWQALMDHYYPDSTWLCLRREVVEQLDQCRARWGLATREQVLERLLAATEEALTP